MDQTSEYITLDLSALDHPLTVQRIRRFLSNTELKEENRRNDFISIVMDGLNLLKDSSDREALLNDLRTRVSPLLSERVGSFSEDVSQRRADNRAMQLVELISSSRARSESNGTPISSSRVRPEYILDVGVGDGTITSALQNHYGLPADRVFGIDVKPGPSDISFTFIQTEEGQTLPFRDGQFDLITANMVLHHVSDLDQLLQEMYRVLSPGGLMIITEHDISLHSEDTSSLTDEEWRGYMTSFLDIVHLLYEVILSDPQETSPGDFMKFFNSSYQTGEEWKDILESYGLNLVRDVPYRNSLMNRYILVLQKGDEGQDVSRNDPHVRSFNDWVRTTLIPSGRVSSVQKDILTSGYRGVFNSTLHETSDSWTSLYDTIDRMDERVSTGEHVVMVLPNSETLLSSEVEGFQAGTDEGPPSYTSSDGNREYIIEIQELHAAVDELGWELILDQTYPEYYTSKDRTLDELESASRLLVFGDDGVFPSDSWRKIEMNRILVWRKA